MKSASSIALAVAVLFSLSACEGDDAHVTGPDGQSAFARFVSIGTSISMGVQSNGVNYSTQVNAWPALLAKQARGNSFTQPLIQTRAGDPSVPNSHAESGCPSPLVAPVAFGRRISGALLSSGTGYIDADTVCKTFSYISLPVNDVAIDGATTYNALYTAPESTATFSAPRRRLYAAVLPPRATQVTSALAQDPTLVSVELGNNEVLGVVSGLVAPSTQYPMNGTYAPLSVWQPVYQRVIDSVATTRARVMLVGVVNIGVIPTLRSGAELYAARAGAAAFGITVSPDCNGSANMVFVPTVVPTLAARAAAGLPAVLSCTDTPGAQDGILTPANVTTISSLVASMNAFIQGVAQQRGWAYFDVNPVLQAVTAARPAYSFSAQLTCSSPYGQYISLDGVHPNSAGHQLVANAAAEVLNTTFKFAIPKNEQPVIPAAQLCP